MWLYNLRIAHWLSSLLNLCIIQLNLQAPECVLCLPYGFSADVYSFAILMWQLCSLQTPFPHYSAAKHYDLVIAKGKRPARLSNVSSPLQKLLERAWAEDPLQRPSFVDICTEIQMGIVSMVGGSSNQSIDDRSTFLTDRSISSLNNNNKVETE